MNLKFGPVSLFWAFKEPFAEQSRKKRMRSYTALMGVREGMCILDLGGTTAIWGNVSQPLNLTILNLPGSFRADASSHHTIRYVEGDACRVHELPERSFDSIFSNSVIEHVGPAERRAAFASEARRLGKSYWVQTPSKWFPIEAHCGMPFWWFYPARLRRYFTGRWRDKLPDWTHMVEETTVLEKTEMQRLFPEATILTETSFGIPKSYIAYYPGN